MLVAAAQIAVIGYIFTEVLVTDGGILEWWLIALLKWDKRIANPLGLCADCFTGQVALWYYIWVTWGDVPNPFKLVYFISVAILLRRIIQKIA